MSANESESVDTEKQGQEQIEPADSPYLDAIDSPDDLNSLDDQDKSQDTDKFQDAESQVRSESQNAREENEKSEETVKDTVDAGSAEAADERMEVDDSQESDSEHDETTDKQQDGTNDTEQEPSDEANEEQTGTSAAAAESDEHNENTSEVNEVLSNNNGTEEAIESATEPMEVDESDGGTVKKSSTMTTGEKAVSESNNVQNDNGEPDDPVMEHDPEQLNCSDLSEPADSTENEKTVSDDPFEALKTSTVNNNSSSTASGAKETVNASTNSGDADSDDEVGNDNDNGENDDTEENDANETANDSHIEGKSIMQLQMFEM